jgi:riboflavin synthase
MFTGIIEALGTVTDIRKEGSNVHYSVSSPISYELKVDQSVSHNGVCLTIVQTQGNIHQVTAILETLAKSNLDTLKVGDQFNLERSMLTNGRFDGHIVQGHVDQVGTCKSVKDENGSWLFDFEYDPGLGNITIEKGSISVNGTSLTCFNSRTNGFTVAIIPFTYEHTNFHQIHPGDLVNLEFDVVGKYIKKLVETGNR